MKAFHRTFLLLVTACMALPLLGIAENPRVNIRIEMQVVAVPEALGKPLVDQMMDEQRIESAYAQIQEMLAKGDAKLLAWPILTTQSGQRATLEGIQEVRYATEFGAPTVSLTPGVNPKEPIKVKPKVDVTQFEGIPTAFETRNVGVTLEVEPSLSEDLKLISLNIVPQHVRLKGMNKITIERGESKTVVEQPEFDVMKVTTSLTLRNGQRVLMGVFRVSEPPDHLEFFILKAEAKKAE